MIDHTESTHGSVRSRAFQTSPSPSARPQHTRGLGGRAVVVEPVPRLRDRDRVERRRGQRQGFGGPRHERDVRQQPAEGGAHACDRLDREQRRAARLEQPGQLAGAGGDVGERRAGREAKMVDEPRDRVGRIRGPRRFVVFRVVETCRRDVVDHVAILPPERNPYRIIPAATVSLVASSTRMNEPVARLRR